MKNPDCYHIWPEAALSASVVEAEIPRYQSPGFIARAGQKAQVHR